MQNFGKNLIKRCAEIYFTTNGLLLFHCVLCVNARLTDVRGLLQHLKKEHHDALAELKCVKNETYSNKKDSCEEIHKSEDECIIGEQETYSNKKDSCEEIYKSEEDECIIEKAETDLEWETSECRDYFSEDVSINDEKDIESVVEVIEFNENSCEQTYINDDEEEEEEQQVFNDNSIDSVYMQTADADNDKGIRTELGAYSKTPRKEGRYKCPVCGRDFTSRNVWCHHLRRHTRPQVACSHCTKKFHTRTELVQHMRRIKGEKPFMCAECGRQFVTSAELTMHRRREHLQDRSFKCEICEKCFCYRYQLKNHQNKVHTTQPVQLHPCTICNAKLKSRKAMVSHMKIHANKREYVCKICQASFNQAPGLHVHFRSKHKDIINVQEKCK